MTLKRKLRMPIRTMLKSFVLKPFSGWEAAVDRPSRVIQLCNCFTQAMGRV